MTAILQRDHWRDPANTEANRRTKTRRVNLNIALIYRSERNKLLQLRQLILVLKDIKNGTYTQSGVREEITK